MASDASKILATPEQDRTEEDKKVLEIIRTEVNVLPKEEQVKFNSMVQTPSWIKETAPLKNLAEQRRRSGADFACLWRDGVRSKGMAVWQIHVQTCRG